MNIQPLHDDSVRPLLAKLTCSTGLLLAGTTILLKSYGLERYAGQLRDLGRIAGYEPAAAGWFTLAALLLFSGYGLIFTLRITRFPPLVVPLVVIATGMLLFGFAMIYPATANDVYLYIVRGRLWTEYGVDPSAVRPVDVMQNDRFAHFMTWQWATRYSPYGPLWNWIAMPGARIASSSMMAAVLAFKLLSGVALLGCAWCIHRLVHAVDRRLALTATLAFLWNPLVLWEAIGNAHNDLIALLPLLCALHCWQRHHRVAIIPLLVTSILIKYTAAPLLPLFVVALWRTTPGKRERITLFAQSGIVTIVICLCSITPFFHAAELWRALSEQRSIITTSIPLIAYLTTIEFGWPIDLQIITTVSMLIVACAALAGCFIIWNDPRRLFTASYWVMFVLLILGTPNLRPWYVVWLLPLALIGGGPRHWLPSLVWSCTGLLSYGYYIWIRDWWHASGFTFETTGVVVTLFPVIVTLVLTHMRRRPNQQSYAFTYTPSR